jgi:hypothetical protein
MKTNRKTPRGTAALALLLACLAPCVFAASPVGEWRLVEQRYEAGAANMMAADLPLHLAFTREGGGLAGRIWAGDDPKVAVSWPAFAADTGPLALEVRDRGEDAATGEVRVRYIVRPSAEDDLVLDVVETYRPSADGTALEGTMRVKFEGGDRNRGGFTLHRRFERER